MTTTTVRGQVKRVEWTAQVIRCGCPDPRNHRNGWVARLRGQPKFIACPNPLPGESQITFTARCIDCGDPDGYDLSGRPYHQDRECRLEGITKQEET